MRFLTYLSFIIFSFSCSTKIDSNTFWVNDYNLNDPVKVSNKDVIHIKNNIYKYKNKLHLAIFHSTIEPNNNGLVVYTDAGNMLLDSINGKKINEIIDLNSYREFKKGGGIHMDKNNLYITQIENGCYQCIKVLNVNVNQIKILDRLSNYVSDGDKVYCLRYGKEINTKHPKAFHVIELNGVSYGIDSTSIYEMCEPMPPSDFMKYYDHIEYKVRDSIIKKYFDQ
ncbi:DKNYY domain-containing protein [Aquimarina algiphila]|uniref:DKNYY domain-containing protein n=1 Tax=Aquimarina algiphila TaxID=2047982 RepID=UPI00232D66E3|nr:DKNYY domain-containing protein [Aquimarina algiphila]